MSLVLVVYDQEAEQETIEKLLAAKGHNVLKARNGLEAIDLVRREHPDAALSDVLLPRMDGFALCRKWKQDDRTQSAPFIFYTTRFDDPKYERFAQEVGADRFFARPDSPDTVISALDEALEAGRRGTGTLRMRSEEVVAAFEREKERERAELQVREVDRERRKAVGALKARVAELEAARQRHVAAEGAYRSLFESAPVPMWIQEEDGGRFVAVNDAAMTRYGYGRAEFLAVDLKALQPGDERPVVATYDRPSPRRHRRKDGALLEVELHVQPVAWHGKRALLVIAYDVTERLRALRALAEREETQRRLVATLPDAVLLLDAEGRVTEVNDAACELSGYRRDELIGRAQGDLIAPADEAGDDARGRLIVKEGEASAIEIRRMPLVGDASRQVIVLRDVSSLASDDRQAAQAFELARRIAALAAVGDAVEAADLLRLATADAVALTQSGLGYLHMLDRPRSGLRLAAWYDAQRGEGAGVDGEPRSPARAGPFGQCAAARSFVLINDPAPRPQPDGLPDLGRTLVVPLLEGDAVLAVLAVANRDRDYQEAEVTALANYADAVAAALARRRREAALAARVELLSTAADSALEALGAVAAHLDPRGPSHARRVATLAAAIAREIGLDEARVERLQTAGLLHDLGMAAVPAGLTAAPRPLDAEERALIARHPQSSADLLARFDPAVAVIVRQHHERLDGSGYPQGLSGEQIDLDARILAVADTVCALGEHRPHRPARSLDAALGEIEKGAGRWYDPHVVAACVRLFRQHALELPV